MRTRVLVAASVSLLACGDAATAVTDAAPTIDAATAIDAGPLVVDYRRLSETGLYAGDPAAGVLADGVEPYAPAYSLWADGAEKARFVWLPPGRTIDTSDMDGWRFPIGTRFWKEFSDPELGRIETRLIVRLGPARDDVFMTSFIWRADGTDAERAPLGAAIPRDGVTLCPAEPTAERPSPDCHYVPAEDACIECHEGQPHRVLGFQAIQLSPPDDPDAPTPSGLDLPTLVERGLLSEPPPGGETYPVPGEGAARDALGYLHANCGHCHDRQVDAPDGCFGLTSFEARLYVEDRAVEDTPLYRTAVNDLVTFWTPAEGNTDELPCRIVPRDPDRSALVRRMSVRDGWSRPHTQMPPIATARPDPDGVATVRAFVMALTDDVAELCE